MVLVGRAPARVWDVAETRAGKMGNIQAKANCFVNHDHFPIVDTDWGHIVIKMRGHPPFGVQIILNGHQYVTRRAQPGGWISKERRELFCRSRRRGEFGEGGRHLVRGTDCRATAPSLPAVIYSSCLLFGLDEEEQRRSQFRYEYKTFRWSSAVTCDSRWVSRWSRCWRV